MEKLNGHKPGKWKRTGIPLLILAVNLILVGILVLQYYSLRSPDIKKLPNGDPINEPEFNMVQIQNHDYSLISPLRLADVTAEFPGFKNLKNSLTLYIQDKRNEGVITDASVYLRKLDDGSWMSIAGNQAYKAGSMFKVPLMICYLKQVENKVISLQQQYLSESPGGGTPEQIFQGKSVTAGCNYTVEELLRYMIIESDNVATYVLLKHVDGSAFQKVFTDLGLNKPQINDGNYQLSVSDYSRFFRVLYNASYLKEEYSNYALKLLSQSNFKEGMAKPLPARTVIAHKFGERADQNEAELSESGIIYQGDKTYLLTVMTKGKEMQELPEVISDISRFTYNEMKE